MILTGPQIKREVANRKIVIDPFFPKQINPNSYNFTLGSTIKIYDEKVIDPRKVNRVIEFEIPKRGLLLRPDRLYLGHIAERIGSNYYVPIIKGRSSVGRTRLFIVITPN